MWPRSQTAETGQVQLKETLRRDNLVINTGLTLQTDCPQKRQMRREQRDKGQREQQDEAQLMTVSCAGRGRFMRHTNYKQFADIIKYIHSHCKKYKTKHNFFQCVCVPSLSKSACIQKTFDL